MTRTDERRIRRIVREEIARWWEDRCRPIRRSLDRAMKKAGFVEIRPPKPKRKKGE